MPREGKVESMRAGQLKPALAHRFLPVCRRAMEKAFASKVRASEQQDYYSKIAQVMGTAGDIRRNAIGARSHIPHTHMHTQSGTHARTHSHTSTHKHINARARTRVLARALACSCTCSHARSRRAAPSRLAAAAVPRRRTAAPRRPRTEPAPCRAAPAPAPA